MRELKLKMSFLWDNENDVKEFILEVPDEISNIYVTNVLRKEHEYLCTKDEKDIYGIVGRSPETLIDYVCKKYGWGRGNLLFDIDMDFN